MLVLLSVVQINQTWNEYLARNLSKENFNAVACISYTIRPNKYNFASYMALDDLLEDFLQESEY